MICIFRLLRFGSGRLGIEPRHQRAVGQRAAQDRAVVLQDQAFGGAAKTHVHIAGTLGFPGRLCQTARAGRGWVQERDDAVGADHTPEAGMDEFLRCVVHWEPPLDCFYLPREDKMVLPAKLALARLTAPLLEIGVSADSTTGE